MTPVFVFGSNLAGRHGKGAALFARLHHGAIYGQGAGRQGNSYALPTKDAQLRTLPLPEVVKHVAAFVSYAAVHSGTTFHLTRVGCGHAKYTDNQICPLFQNAPYNVHFPPEWRVADPNRQYWQPTA